jgi:hypothetical protein
MVWCALEHRVFLYDACVKYGSARKCRRKFRREVRDERVLSRQIHNLVNKLRATELSTDKKQKHKRVLTEEKLDDTGARLVHTPRKSSKPLAQETGVSKSSARKATQFLKHRPYKTTAIHAHLADT